MDAALDKLMAEQVMGWEFLTVGYWDSDSETPRQKELEDWLDTLKCAWDRYGGSIGDYYINVVENFILPTERFRPTERIADAWMVLDKLTEQGYEWTIAQTQGAVGAFACLIRRSDTPLFIRSQLTAPMAICMAVKKVVESR